MKIPKKHIAKKRLFLTVVFGVLFTCLIGCFLISYYNRKDVDTTVHKESNVKSSIEKENLERLFSNKWFSTHSLRGKVNNATEDKAITLQWDVPAEKVSLSVFEDKTRKHIQTIDNMKGVDEYRFTNGEHGTKYVFRLTYVDDKGVDKSREVYRTFLDFNKLPNIETFFIETNDKTNPSYDVAEKPDNDLFGITIVNNEYKKGMLNKKIPMQIRVRGNSSAIGMKKSYKIVLKEKRDLLNLGEEYADTEWVLLGKSSILQTYLGLQLGMFLGMEWEPRMRFVNLVLNGKWQGLYILCESIKSHPKRVALSEDGFLIESDGYFWKEKGPFLESSLLSSKVKFTFKYPKITSQSDEKFSIIEKRIQTVENAIETQSENIEDLIDIDNFISWILAHEIMGTRDGYGSNVFFYQYDTSKESKLKIGPLWDFDFTWNGRTEKHSALWHTKATYIPLLLTIPKFMDKYKEKYFSVAPFIEPKIQSILEELRNTPGLKDSVQIDENIMNVQISLDIEIDGILKRLHDKISWLNEEVERL